MDFCKQISTTMMVFVGLLLLTILFTVLANTPIALAADLNCTFKASCGGGETVVLFAQNDAATDYDNAHVAVNNQTPYAFSLCCLTDGSHTLNASCDNENTSAILKASSLSNAHVQIPSLNDYDYDICLGTDYGALACEYVNTTCSGGYAPLLSMASSGTTNVTNAHVGNYSYYALNVCCQIGKSPPETPVLLSPVDNNLTVFERNVTLMWAAAYEPDGDVVTYNVSLNVSAVTCSVEHSQEMDISATNFTTNELCHNPENYTWSVQACDVDGCSAWATPFFFQITSVLGVRFLQNTTDFGSLDIQQSKATDAGDANPMVIENDGNIYINITIKANQSLFEQVSLDNTNFMYRGISSNATSVQGTYANMLLTDATLFNNLSYIDSQDSGVIHYNVTVPVGEQGGRNKSSLITVTAGVPP